MKAVVLAVHRLESPRALNITVSSFLRYGVVPIFVFDKLSSELTNYMSELRRNGIDFVPISGFRWLTTQYFGVGMARDVGIRHAYELGFDCIIISDTHVKLLEDPSPLCREGLWQGMRIDAPFSSFPNPPPNARPWFGRMYSVDLSRYVEVYDCTYKPWSYEPLSAISRSAVKALMDAKSGLVIVGRGFGAELAELSMSVARLGFPVGCVKVGYIHRVSSGDEDFWKKRWDETQLQLWRESFGVYMLMHVPKERWRTSPYLGFDRYVDPVRAKIAIQFNDVAKLTTYDVYNAFIRSNPVTNTNPSILL